MNAGRIGFWERHAEKLVIGLVVASTAALAIRSVIGGDPDAVTVDGERLGPREVDAALARRARALDERLRSGEAGGLLGEGWPRDLAREIETALASVSPTPRLPLAGPSVAPGTGGAMAEAMAFDLPTIDAPHGIAVRSDLDTLADGVVDAHPELASYFEAAQPPDLRVVTAVARVDVAAIRSRFDDAGVPEFWHRGGPCRIVDVVIRRQELVDRGWSEPLTLAPNPGQRSFREVATRVVTGAERDDLLVRLDDPATQAEVMRPLFYPTRNDAIEPVSAFFDEPDAPADAPGALSRLARMRAERSRLADLYARDCGGRPPDAADEAGAGSRPPGRGGGFNVGRDRGKRLGDDAEDPRAGSTPGRCATLAKQIEHLDQEIDALLDTLGDDASAARVATTLLVWGYDITAEPGRTYRYAIAVRVANPFHGRGHSLVETQQELAGRVTLESAQSAWSAPVRVEPMTRLEIVRASADGGPGSTGRVTATVHRYHDGRHWAQVFSASPGDMLGGVHSVRPGDLAEPVEVDFSTGLCVVDIVADPDAAARSGPSRPAMVLLQDLGTRILELRDPHEGCRILWRSPASGEA